MRKVAVVLGTILIGHLLSACSAKMPVNAASESHSLYFKPVSTMQSVRNYSYDYNQVVNNAAYNDVYVICGDCPAPTKLERELTEVPITVFWGKEGVVSTASSSRPEQQMITPNLTMVLAEESASQKEPTEPSQKPEKIVNPDPKMKSSVIRKDSMGEGSVFSCITPAIQFDFDSAVLRDNEKLRIKTSLDHLKKAKAITVKGYTCDAGSKEYNDRLALERAKAVAGYLEEQGIKPSAVIGEGKCCYVSEEGSKNRRAEIFCQKSKGE